MGEHWKSIIIALSLAAHVAGARVGRSDGMASVSPRQQLVMTGGVGVVVVVVGEPVCGRYAVD